MAGDLPTETDRGFRSEKRPTQVAPSLEAIFFNLFASFEMDAQQHKILNRKAKVCFDFRKPAHRIPATLWWTRNSPSGFLVGMLFSARAGLRSPFPIV